MSWVWEFCSRATQIQAWNTCMQTSSRRTRLKRSRARTPCRRILSMAQDEALISAEQMKTAWMMAAAVTERLDRIRAVPVPAKRGGLNATLTAEGHRGFLITLD